MIGQRIAVPVFAPVEGNQIVAVGCQRYVRLIVTIAGMVVRMDVVGRVRLAVVERLDKAPGMVPSWLMNTFLMVTYSASACA